MPLNWRVNQCDERVMSDEEQPITEAVIWSTMRVGIPQITDDNAEKFTARLYAWTRVHGPVLTKATERGIEPVPIRLADVRLRIGLQTNAKRLTDAAFKTQLIHDVMLDAQAQLAREAVPAEPDST